MIPRFPPPGLVPALCLLAAPALAGPAEDCRNPDLARADRIAPCTAAIGAAADVADKADLLLYRGANLYNTGDYAAAEADFAAARKLRPDWADPYVERGYMLQSQGDDAGAAAEMREGLRVEPGSTYAVVGLMSLLADAGRWQECFDTVALASPAAQSDPEVVANRGRCRAELGDHEAALADDRDAIARGYDEAWVHGNMAWSLIALDRPEEAVEEARLAVSREPGFVNGHRNLIEALVQVGRVDEAVDDFRLADLPEPADRMQVANTLAWSLFQAGRGDKGLPFAQDAMAAMGEAGLRDADVVDTYAHLLMVNGRPDDAAKAFMEAVAIDPGYRDGYARRLAGLGYPGDPAQLEASLLACAKTGPGCGM
ncbi:hypothetical protein Rumeso_04942 [Rubellimicrobium mesophilum DSM 19309]|uniref:Uncharacterized protein n=1 Tax=Rubellimicrobium mesophilum DSM 19309 TaxID=442562 RepID=A0A017HB21_9RHOB|nr:tetratricopeptide repeat protein [Rubellimicrobium mesophilum]EYD71541.1 hypothetical protein Rumeso_04942 [Rubellimicrobium mesophilum DSM 19309]